jgi:hypothetical protein
MPIEAGRNPRSPKAGSRIRQRAVWDACSPNLEGGTSDERLIADSAPAAQLGGTSGDRPKSSHDVGLLGRICAGKNGLLSGRAATTIHSSYADFAMEFPRYPTAARSQVRGRWQSRLLGRTLRQPTSRADSRHDGIPGTRLVWTQIRTRPMPKYASPPANTPSARCARWMVILR